MQIYGAGMAGLLAAVQLWRYRPTLHEAQSSLPDNHGALLRFRSDIVEQVTNIPFRRVMVQKALCKQRQLYHTTTIADANAYSRKVLDAVLPGRSIWSLDPVERYIAPPDFLQRLLERAAPDQHSVHYGDGLTAGTLHRRSPTDPPLISTIPMPVLMELSGWMNGAIKFHSREIWSMTCEVMDPYVDVHQTVYYPYEEPFYRASLTGNKLILEFIQDPISWEPVNVMADVLGMSFGIEGEVAMTQPIIKHQRFGKLLPISEYERRRFIRAMTEQYAVYSVGRFATWRQLLLDDVVHDINVVERIMGAGRSYERALMDSRVNLES